MHCCPSQSSLRSFTTPLSSIGRAFTRQRSDVDDAAQIKSGGGCRSLTLLCDDQTSCSGGVEVRIGGGASHPEGEEGINLKLIYHVCKSSKLSQNLFGWGKDAVDGVHKNVTKEIACGQTGLKEGSPVQKIKVLETLNPALAFAALPDVVRSNKQRRRQTTDGGGWSQHLNRTGTSSLPTSHGRG